MDFVRIPKTRSSSPCPPCPRSDPSPPIGLRVRTGDPSANSTPFTGPAPDSILRADSVPLSDRVAISTSTITAALSGSDSIFVQDTIPLIGPSFSEFHTCSTICHFIGESSTHGLRAPDIKDILTSEMAKRGKRSSTKVEKVHDSIVLRRPVIETLLVEQPTAAPLQAGPTESIAQAGIEGSQDERADTLYEIRAPSLGVLDTIIVSTPPRIALQPSDDSKDSLEQATSKERAVSSKIGPEIDPDDVIVVSSRTIQQGTSCDTPLQKPRRLRLDPVVNPEWVQAIKEARNSKDFLDTTIVDSSSVDSRSAIYLRRRSDISTLQLAGYANAMNVKMEVVDEDVFMSGSIGGHELSEKPREDAPDTDPSESLVGAASLNPDPSPLRITLKVSQLSSKKRKHPVRGIEETLVRVKKEKIEGNGLDSTRVDTAATPLVEKVVNATAMKATASKKASSRVTPIRKKRGRPREKIVAEHVLHLIKTGKISSKNRRKVGVESFDARNRTRAVSVPAFSRTGIRKYKSQAKSPQTQRPRRAASEVATNANVKVEVRRRHESAPPVRKEEQGETCHGLETPMELESNNRDKRAFTEGLFSPPPSPALAAQGAKSATPRKACQTKEIATPDSKRKKHQRSTVSLDSINSYRTPIQAQAGSNATIQGDLDLTESDPSDAMDISDDDLGVEINPTPEYIEQKLARAAMRERLKLRDMERLSTQTIPGALLRSELDRRYAAEVLILKDGIWCVPKSCFRCLEGRSFCDRNTPCGKCAARGNTCGRAPGWIIARARGVRGAGKAQSSTPKRPTIKLKIPKIEEILPDCTPSPISPDEAPTPNSKGRKRISKAITDRDDPDCVWVEKPHPQRGLPLCRGTPEVWCTNRQELCESLPYFRSYQSGTYHSGGVMRGYLLDGCAGPRDFVNGRVVVSHSGGKSVMDEDGSRKLVTSQLESGLCVRDLVNNLRGQWPMVLIMGNQCTTSPSKLPHRYCVLGWFKVTAAWAERDPATQLVRWMFRFEKFDSSNLGWWAPPNEVYEPGSAASDAEIEMVKASCTLCREESPQVYEQGWMCLRPQCKDFWKLNGNGPPNKLVYAQTFINCRTVWDPELEIAPTSLRPPLSTDRDNYYDGGDVSRVYWKGMCCPECGRLSCRELWAGWKCKSCPFFLNPPRTHFEADRLLDPHRPIYTGPAVPHNLVQPEITWTRSVKDGMTCLTYHLKDCGTVTHLLASEMHNKREQSADWLFKEYQSSDMPFRRYPLKSHRVQGQLLTQQFSFNAGAPYKYIVAIDSTPFEQSPRAVTRSLELIEDRVRLVHPDAQFNEILSVGYFEGQKMDYHDDGEEELGDTVASISFGSPAKMKFRVKAKYMATYKLSESKSPAKKRVKIEPADLGVGAVIDEEALLDPALDLGDAKEDDDDGDNNRTNQKDHRVKLELRLNHGDVVVMRGREIQRIWEHAVTPIGLFRIAATARWINVPEPRVKNPQTTASNAVIVKAGPIKPEPMQVEEVAPPSEHNIRAEEETELVNSKEILAVAQLEPMAEIAPGRVIEDPAATVVKPEPSVNIGPNEGMAIGKGALVDSNVTNINEKIKNKAAAIGVPLKFEAMAPPTTSDPCPKILQEPLSSSTKMAVEPGEWFFVDGHQKPQASAGMAPIAQFA